MSEAAISPPYVLHMLQKNIDCELRDRESCVGLQCGKDESLLKKKSNHCVENFTPMQRLWLGVEMHISCCTQSSQILCGIHAASGFTILFPFALTLEFLSWKTDMSQVGIIKLKQSKIAAETQATGASHCRGSNKDTWSRQDHIQAQNLSYWYSRHAKMLQAITSAVQIAIPSQSGVQK